MMNIEYACSYQRTPKIFTQECFALEQQPVEPPLPAPLSICPRADLAANLHFAPTPVPPLILLQMIPHRHLIHLSHPLPTAVVAG